MNSRRIITITLNPTIDRVLEVPGLVIGGHVRGRLRSRLPAGKALNVARTLAVLDVHVTVMGFVGQESAGFVESALNNAGVIPQFTPIAGTDRENVTLVDPITPSETHIRDEGPSVSDEEIKRLEANLYSAAGHDAIMVFTGSLAPGLSPERFGHMLDGCIARGAAIAIDMVGDPLRVAVERPCRLIKPNLLELCDLLGRDLPDDESLLAAGHELAKRIPLLLVTLGKRGAYCFTPHEVWFARTTVPADQVRSTVGCGDATLGAFLAGYASDSADASVERALRQAVAVAAASAMNDRPAFFEPGDARRLSASAEVRRVRSL